MRGESEHGVKDHPQDPGVFIKGDLGVVDGDGWVTIVLAGPGGK